MARHQTLESYRRYRRPLWPTNILCRHSNHNSSTFRPTLDAVLNTVVHGSIPYLPSTLEAFSSVLLLILLRRKKPQCGSPNHCPHLLSTSSHLPGLESLTTPTHNLLLRPLRPPCHPCSPHTLSHHNEGQSATSQDTFHNHCSIPPSPRPGPANPPIVPE